MQLNNIVYNYIFIPIRSTLPVQTDTAEHMDCQNNEVTFALDAKYMLWKKKRHLLASTFSNHASVTSLATQSVARLLISKPTLQRIFNNTNPIHTNDIRATMLIMFIQERAINDPSIFETFLGSMTDPVFENMTTCLSKLYGSNLKIPQQDLFIHYTDTDTVYRTTSYLYSIASFI